MGRRRKRQQSSIWKVNVEGMCGGEDVMERERGGGDGGGFTGLIPSMWPRFTCRVIGGPRPNTDTEPIRVLTQTQSDRGGRMGGAGGVLDKVEQVTRVVGRMQEP
ncbi:unnamed protein product [Pleuronectes platessa]|uniref:Uncharacterized protein n=1 Tax=Pleuronectes platessa TaxID=8262 RepID=A0A9N7VPY7_PLEPL|nr:unnamed protein product [Pleuronectes platessa]